MALSSTPADPPAAAATSATTPRLFAAAPPPSRDPRPPISPYPHPPSHYHHRLPSQQPHQQPLYASQPFANLAPRGGGAPSSTTAANRGILYPVASSGRGFLPKAIRSQSAAAADQIANQAGFPPRPVLGGPPYSHTVRAFGFPHSDPHAHLIRPPHVHQTFLGSTGVISAAVKGVPVSGQLKVRIYEGSSLYALCRSWLRNGYPEEPQPQYVDGVKLLPKPSPSLVLDAPIKKEVGDEEEERSVENLSSQDLLQRHVKRAKRVRAQLREERLQRIARYKTRLALLLPPLAEQQFRNDTAASN
ncbi:formin-like protein 18 isoform X3 [Rhododendron vialii]|uniref:formin-like protein 18 isoform X3 n=1 Tax=Rhododendron vialii TaxID=182163 RepID=UPI00265FC294|nr:formin-like protein 18 isoform X3 [Rhododendron vialii]